ncbi:MAG: hypothetical protein ACXWEY_07315 [Bacteroidia bacterium]
MKTLYILCLMLFAWSTNLHAQDKILTRNGDMLAGKVLQVDSIKILYIALADSTMKDTLRLAADTQSINIADVFMLKFRNGTKTVFNEIEAEPEAGNTKTEDPLLEEYSSYELLDMGEKDAKSHFKASGVFLASAASGFVGGLTMFAFPLNIVTAAPPAIMIISDPKPANFRTPNPEALKNSSYRYGYIKKAEAKKLNNAIGGYLAGTAVGVTTLVVGLIILFF